jgi:hypothetical protein
MIKKDEAEIFSHTIKRAAAKKLWKDIETIRKHKPS